jgi:hypothetical protein
MGLTWDRSLGQRLVGWLTLSRAQNLGLSSVFPGHFLPVLGPVLTGASVGVQSPKPDPV